jgi:hypothetical protein
VEHAFLLYVFGRYRAASSNGFWANYRKTARNAQAGQVFNDIGMDEVETQSGVTSFIMPTDRPLPVEDVIDVFSALEPLGAALTAQSGTVSA